MFGFDSGTTRYRQPGQTTGTAIQSATTTNANTKRGVLGFFSDLFTGSTSSASRSSSGYLQPATSPTGDIVLCQEVEGEACQPMGDMIACQPVDGVACQPVTMIPGPPPGP